MAFNLSRHRISGCKLYVDVPNHGGNDGYALTTNGSGTLAWSDLSPVVTVDGVISPTEVRL